MEKMIDLLDLLKHHVSDLFSAEEQIIEALPDMINKASNPDLVAALKDHLQVTKVQRTRLQEVQKLINVDDGSDTQLGENKGGFLSRFFGGSTEKCKAMEGLIAEGQKIMGEDMVPEVMDSAIIGAAQKIEHYEISGYGTARAFAKELRMDEIERLFKLTLDEEYQVDDSLTRLAVGKLNILAEEGLQKNPELKGKSKPKKSTKASISNDNSSKNNSSKSSGKSNNTSRKSPGRSAAKKKNATSLSKSGSNMMLKDAKSTSKTNKGPAKNASKGSKISKSTKKGNKR